MPPISAAQNSRELRDISSGSDREDNASISSASERPSEANPQAAAAPRTGNNAAANRMAANTAQLLQQLSPLLQNSGNGSSSSNPQSTLFSQTHAYIRHLLFIQFFYIYLLDRSLLLLAIRFMTYLILIFVRRSKRQASMLWTSMLVFMLIFHTFEVLSMPSWYFQWDGLIRNYGPSPFNWLKNSLDDTKEGMIVYWERKIYILIERIVCDVLIWAVGYLTVWIEWKRDSLDYLRGPPAGQDESLTSRRRSSSNNQVDEDDSTHASSNDEDIHITINNDVIDTSSLMRRGGMGTSGASSTLPSSSSQQDTDTSSLTGLHRRRTTSGASGANSSRNDEATELSDLNLNDRSTLLSNGGVNNGSRTRGTAADDDDDLFDSVM